MVFFEFGKAEKQTLERNSVFISFKFGWDTKGKEEFSKAITIIKQYWNRVYHPNTNEWEVPFSCYEEIKQLYNGYEIYYKNDPPKAKIITQDDIVNGMDFNGFNLYDYQLEGVKYGLNHTNWLLLDEQGLRKNITSNNISKI